MKNVLCSTFTLLALALMSALAQSNKPLTEADLASPPRSGGDPVRLTDELKLDLPSMKPSAGRKEKEEPAAKKKAGGTTEITAREGLFSQKQHQAIFSIEVVVVNPEFHLTCDKLTADLKQAAPKARPDPNAGPAVDAASPAAAGGTPVKPAKESKGGGLERAIAEGSVVITQEKAEPNGQVTRNIGRAKKAVYEASTGNITLTGRPEVQTGINSCVALEEGTVMVLNRNGEMKVFGDHKTVIRDASSPELGGNAR